MSPSATDWPSNAVRPLLNGELALSRGVPLSAVPDWLVSFTTMAKPVLDWGLFVLVPDEVIKPVPVQAPPAPLLKPDLAALVSAAGAPVLVVPACVTIISLLPRFSVPPLKVVTPATVGLPT